MSTVSPNGAPPPGTSNTTAPTSTPNNAIPTGPRAGNFPYRNSLPAAHSHHHHRPSPSGPGAIIPGGRLLPPVDKASEDRLTRLRADQVKLEEENKSIQERKRKGLYGWEKSQREAEREGFKVELAEGSLVGGGMD
ncbi:hypothetical protein Q9L58_006633 [Maublancomyces gigas]|uniref:Uncharacterized protein n=1 Tax=Discina gigas TaxID=1032678 RepID=A0ABR3GES6_9PEZI